MFKSNRCPKLELNRGVIPFDKSTLTKIKFKTVHHTNFYIKNIVNSSAILSKMLCCVSCYVLRASSEF